MDTSHHILVVEDEKDSSELLEFMLQEVDEDYTITSVPSGEEALSLLVNRSFDLYILDYKLPKMTGVQLCRLIRVKDTKTPIMFFTGMDHWLDKRAALKAGASEYLIKTKDLDKFAMTIRQLLCENNLNAV